MTEAMEKLYTRTDLIQEFIGSKAQDASLACYSVNDRVKFAASIFQETLMAEMSVADSLNNNELTLTDIIRITIRHWMIVAICTLGIGALGYLYIFPKYSSTINIFLPTEVSPELKNWLGTSADYKRVLDSMETKLLTWQQLPTDTDASVKPDYVQRSIFSAGNDKVLEAIVDAPNTERAVQVSNLWGKIFYTQLTDTIAKATADYKSILEQKQAVHVESLQKLKQEAELSYAEFVKMNTELNTLYDGKRNTLQSTAEATLMSLKSEEATECTKFENDIHGKITPLSESIAKDECERDALMAEYTAPTATLGTDASKNAPRSKEDLLKKLKELSAAIQKSRTEKKYLEDLSETGKVAIHNKFNTKESFTKVVQTRMFAQLDLDEQSAKIQLVQCKLKKEMIDTAFVAKQKVVYENTLELQRIATGTAVIEAHIQYATLSGAVKAGYSRTIGLALGFVAGFLLGVGLSIVVDFITKAIKSKLLTA